MTWKEKLQTLTSKWHPERDELSTVATTGDYNDLINAPQGGEGGSFTPYVLKLSTNIVEDAIIQANNNYNNFAEQITQGIERSQEIEVSDELIYTLLYLYNIGGWSPDQVEFFAMDGPNRYYPYKVEMNNNFTKIYFYDLPLEHIYLYSIPKIIDNTNISFEIIDGVYEYQYSESEPEPEPNPGQIT